MKRSGFTLAELILVVIIVTIMAGLVAPRFATSLPGAKLNKASSDLHSVIMKVRADTVILVKRHRLHIDPAAGSFWVEVEENAMKEPGVFTQATGPLRHVFNLPEDVVFTTVDAPAAPVGNSRAYTFLPDGTTEGGSIVLGLAGNGESRTLWIDGATSNVEVTD